MSFDTSTIEFIIIAGAFVANIVLALATWYNGRASKRSSDENDALTTIKIKDLTIDTLSKENKELKEKYKSDVDQFNGQFKVQGERIAVLEADNKRLEAIVANRNPELENFMKSCTESLTRITEGLTKLLEKPTVSIHNEK